MLLPPKLAKRPTKYRSLLKISAQPILASGGWRHVYQHPEDPKSLLKVIRPDITPKGWSLRSEKRDFGPYREWYCEQKEYISIINRTGTLPDFIAEYRGMCQTDLGPAQIVEKISNESDNALSKTLSQSLNDFTEAEIRAAYNTFITKVSQARAIIGDIHFKNLLVKRDHNGQIASIICVDGLGERTWIKVRKLSDFAYNRWLNLVKIEADKNITQHYKSKAAAA